MDCPMCEETDMIKDGIKDWERLDGERILIKWEAHCPGCWHSGIIEEEFETTGWEKEVKE